MILVSILSWFALSYRTQFPRPSNDREIAVIRIKPIRILQNPYVWSTCFDRLVPSHISPSQLAAVGVDSLTIRSELRDVHSTGPAITRNPIRWSVVARLEKPLATEEFFRRWQTAKVVGTDSIDFEVIEVNKERHLVRVPAGTFLAPIAHPGKLHFENAQGERLKQGTNVGYLDPYWEFVEGGTGKKAVFHFSGLTKDSLVDGNLPLDLVCCDFRINDRVKEPLQLQVRLRNPANRLISKPVLLEVNSLEQIRLSIPALLSIDSDASDQEADLLRDFVVAGDVDVLLSLDQKLRYLGVGRNSLQVHHQAYEYVAIANDNVSVADTQESLQSAMATSDTQDQSRSDRDLDCSLYIDTPEKKLAMERLLNGDACMELEYDWFQSIQSLHIHANCLPAIKMRVDMETEPTTLEQNKIRFLAMMERHAEQSAFARNSAYLPDPAIRFLQWAFGGRNMVVPSGTKLDGYWYSKLLRTYVDTMHAVTDTQIAIDRIRFEFSQPKCDFRDEDERNGFLANVQLYWALNQFENFRHELSNYGLERSLDYLPDDTTLRLRIAHQLSFNTPGRFHGEAKHRWICRALHLLMDAIEATPENCENYWAAAKVVAKTTTWDDVRGYFAEDDELQTRLRRITTSSVSPQDWNTNGWIVARLLLEKAIDCYEKSGSAGKLKPILLYSDEAKSYLGYAKFLAEEGRFDESERAWRSTLDRYSQLGDRRIITIDSKLYCMNDILKLLARKQSDLQFTKKLNREMIRTEFLLDISAARLQLKPPLQEANKAFFMAKNSLAEGDKSRAISIMKTALEKLADAMGSGAESMILARCIEPEMRQYHWLCDTERGSDLPADKSQSLRRLEIAFAKFQDLQTKEILEFAENDDTDTSNPE